MGKVGLGAELNLGVFMLNFLLNSVEQKKLWLSVGTRLFVFEQFQYTRRENQLNLSFVY